jgi:low temperature requirement protein LtrA
MIARPTDSALRQRGATQAKVSFAELFFDLVYVFAVTQLSHKLLGDLTALGALQTLLLWGAVWLGWQYTCWVTNWFDPERLPIRALLFGVMLLALPMAAAIPQAFGRLAWVFAGCYVTIQVGRTLYVLWHLGPAHALTPNFRRILGWNLIAGMFWLAGAWATGPARLALWASAVACEYVSPMFGFRLPGLGRSVTSDWTIDGAHLAERCQLFMIVALGESILLIGATLGVAESWDGLTLAAFGTAFVSSLAMWWIYFDTSSVDGSHAIEHSDDPGRIGAYFHYVHVLIVGGVIVCAVGHELVVAHPHGHVDVGALAVMLGGVALYLAGNALFKRLVNGRWALSHGVALALLLLCGLFAGHLDMLSLAALTTALLVGVAAWDGCTRRAGAHRFDASPQT